MYKILIADDELTERKGIETLLRRRSLPVEIFMATDGEEALAVLENEDIDILISDVKMPKLNGLELCRRIRQTDRNLVIILQSAYDDFDFMRRAIQMHVDDYILKPVVISEFDAVIDQAIESLATRSAAITGHESRIVNDVLRIIEEHYAENIGLEWIADKIGLSAGYLSGVFKTEYGKGLTQYLTAYRMEKAKELLCNTTLRIADVGQQVGYPNTSYFCQLFRKHHGITANAMRENNQK